MQTLEDLKLREIKKKWQERQEKKEQAQRKRREDAFTDFAKKAKEEGIIL